MKVWNELDNRDVILVGVRFTLGHVQSWLDMSRGYKIQCWNSKYEVNLSCYAHVDVFHDPNQD